MSVKETAELLGYADIYTFSHQFTGVVEISPGKYREAAHATDCEDVY